MRIIEEDRPEPAADSNGQPAAPRAERRLAANDELFEVFAEQEFLQQITELLLTAAPQLTGSGIVELRGRLLDHDWKNGWVE